MGIMPLGKRFKVEEEGLKNAASSFQQTGTE